MENVVVERFHPSRGKDHPFTIVEVIWSAVVGKTSDNRKQFRMKYRAVAGEEGRNSFENCARRQGEPGRPGIISRERNFHWRWISNLEHGRKQKPPIWMKTAERAARCPFFFLKGTYPLPVHRFKLPLPAFSPCAACIMRP